MGDKCKPVSSTPVTGTPWCIVWTGDKRVFFYNPSTKSSVWERPPELIGRLDVEELLASCPATKLVPALPIKKVEATSSTSDQLNAAIAAAAAAAKQLEASNNIAGVTLPDKLSSNKPVNAEKRGLDQVEFAPGEEPSEKRCKTEDEVKNGKF